MNVIVLYSLFPVVTSYWYYVNRVSKSQELLFRFYIFGLGVSLFLNQGSAIPDHTRLDERIWIFLLYGVLLSAYLILGIKVKSITSKTVLPRGKKTSLIFAFLSILGFFSFFYQIPYAARSMFTEARDVRLLLNQGEYSAFPKNLFTTVATGISSFYVVYMNLFFIALIQDRSKYIRLGLFFGVLSYVINTLAFAGRDGIVFSSIISVMIFTMYRQLMTAKQVRSLVYVFRLFAIGGFVILSLVTISRFIVIKGSLSEGLSSGVFGYVGMQPFIFNDYLVRFSNYTYGAKNFSIFREILGFDYLQVPEPQDSIEWQFGSFLASFFRPNGWPLFIGINLFFIFLFRSILSYKNSAWFTVLSTSFYFQFMVTGFFYFRMGNEAGNKVILITLILLLILRFIRIDK